MSRAVLLAAVLTFGGWAAHSAGVAAAAPRPATVASGGSLSQSVDVTVRPGPLTISPATESLLLASAQGAGPRARYGGALPAMTVDDARSTFAGWTATVSLRSLKGLDPAQLAQARLCVDPASPSEVAGNPREVAPGHVACGRVGDTLTVFSAPAGGGEGVFSDTARLTLWLPGSGAPDSVTATVALGAH